MSVHRVLAGILALAIIAPAGFTQSGSVDVSEIPSTLEDARGASVDVSDVGRIASIGGLITETLYALGAGDRVVAVDTSSLHPEGVEDRHPVVGYVRALSAEGVISTEPSIVMTIADAGPPEVIAQIEGAGIPVFVVPTEDSVAGAKNAISTIGRIVSRVEQAQALIQEIDADVAGARSYVDRVTAAGDAEQRSATFVYARGAGTLMVSGISTSADAMIELAGARNAVRGYRGYKPLTPEALVAAAPEVLIFTNSGLRSIGGVEGAREIPGVDQTPAGRHGRFIAMDDLYLLGFGPRLGEAVRDLSQRIYPEGEGL